MTEKQKRVALITDFSGFGRCSTTVALPIISAMKIQCCVLPTAILSAHTGYPNFHFDDFTGHMQAYMDNWKELGVDFDGIAVGYLGNRKQIAEVEHFFELFRREGTLVVLDPVMGDNGSLYASYSRELCDEMKSLLPYADVITPNLTEACFLLGQDYHQVDTGDAGLEQLAAALSAMGPKKVVITGLNHADKISNFVYEEGRYCRIDTRQIGGNRAGTGDVFTAVLFASLIRGLSFVDAVQKAVYYINKCLAYTEKLQIPAQDGICFEEYLTELR